MEYKDYYATLGVPRTATQAEIKKAFRKLARQHHPDVNKGDAKAERRFKDLNEANAVLSDPEKRTAYDELGANWAAYEAAASAGPAGAGRPGDPFARGGRARAPEAPGGIRFEYTGGTEDLGGFSDFFRTFFGGATGTGRGRAGGGTSIDLDELLGRVEREEQAIDRASQRRNGRGGRQPSVRHAEAETSITLEEAFRGTERIVQVDDKRLEVRIPAGVESGQRIRLTGKAGTGVEAGNVYLIVTVRDHPVFTRERADLHRELPITLEEALLGAEVPVETLGGRVLLKIPPGTQNGRTFRLAGQGMPRLRGTGRGDLYGRTRVVLPTGLDDEARRSFEEFARHVRQPDPRAGAGARAGRGQ